MQLPARLVELQAVDDGRFEFKARSVGLGQFVTAVSKLRDTLPVDELQGTAGPDWKAYAKNRADIGLMYAAEHPFLRQRAVSTAWR